MLVAPILKKAAKRAAHQRNKPAVLQPSKLAVTCAAYIKVMYDVGAAK
ncbi:hypothetical protein [Paraburkholderia sp. UCT70]